MKIMLDECLACGPAMLIRQFSASSDPNIEVVFLLDYLGQERGIKDHTWVDQISGEGGWSVITADWDKRKTGKKRLADGPPLHTILPKKGISAVYLAPNIQLCKGSEKARAVISLWPDIVNFLKTARAGSRMTLRKQAQGTGFQLRAPGE